MRFLRLQTFPTHCRSVIKLVAVGAKTATIGARMALLEVKHLHLVAEGGNGGFGEFVSDQYNGQAHRDSLKGRSIGS